MKWELMVCLKCMSYLYIRRTHKTAKDQTTKTMEAQACTHPGMKRRFSLGGLKRPQYGLTGCMRHILRSIYTIKREADVYTASYV